MKIVKSQERILERLTGHIKRYGHLPEHHPYLFLYYDVAKGYTPTYFDFGAEGGVITYQKGYLWRTVSEPIAERPRKVTFFHKVLTHIFTKERAKKITFEDCTADFHALLVDDLASSQFRPTKPFYQLSWPVVDLAGFTEELVGRELKGMRYARNRFLKYHVVDVRDARGVAHELLTRLIATWVERRKAHDTAYTGEYVKMAINGFPLSDLRRAIFIDGTFRAVSAGWRIPNSTSYYLFLDIHDYSDPYLGEFVSLDHLVEARRAGFSTLDFGGSDEGLLLYKMKFHPKEIYKTYNFSILRR